MRRFTGFQNYARLFAWALMLPLCTTASVWAQGLNEPEKPEASWVLSYVLIVMCVGAGLFVICRTGRREK